jgi:hypothetical protein
MNNTTFSAIMVGSFVTLVLIIGVNGTYAENQVRNLSADQGIDVHCEGNTSNDSVGHIRMQSRSEEFKQEFVYCHGGPHPASIIGDGDYDHVIIRCDPFDRGSIEHITLKDGELVSVTCI